MTPLSDKQLEDSLQKTLKENNDCKKVWVFAYGALMWAPCFKPEASSTGILKGWARKPCLWTLTARGSPKKPGIVFALDEAKGKVCNGLLLKISPSRLKTDLLSLWQREMYTGLYKPAWLPVTTEGKEIMAICFVVNRDHKLFIKYVSKISLIYAISDAQGEYGTCLEYYQKTLSSLNKLGLEDKDIQKLTAEVMKRSNI